MRAKEAALKEAANSKLRRLLAYDKSCNRANIAIRDPAPFYKAQSRKSTPRWRALAEILGIGETGVTATFQWQTFEFVRYWGLKRVGPIDAGGVE